MGSWWMSLNFIAPINTLGYGRVGTEIASAYNRLEEVALFPIGQPEVPLYKKSEMADMIRRADTYDVNAPCVRLWHQFDMSMFVGKGAHIGWSIFELDRLTEKEANLLGRCDHNIVCSAWAAQVLLKYGINSSIVPLGYNEHFFPINRPIGRVRFLNMGKWEIRKGHDILVDIFNAAFTDKDDVELLMCNHNPFYSDEKNKEWEKKYKASKLGHKIKIIPRLATDSDVANLMRHADCGIFPSRAEGWNLEACEMMGCGKPVIMTDYAGQSEFVLKEYAIPYTKKVIAQDGKWFFGQGEWVEPDFDATVELMRNFYKNPKTIQPPPLTWDRSASILRCVVSTFH
jgi:glycosyltransferase involved in cell wall biosynthesis